MRREDVRLNLSAGAASVLVAAALVALKLWALGQTHALSVAASLTDSAIDLLVSVSGLMAIIYAAKPADEDHAFGHTSAEDLAALAQAVLVTVSALVIGYGAIERLTGAHDADVIHAEGRGIIVMVLSISLTLALVLWQRRVARRTGSKVVAADSLHYLSDLLPNLGAVAALAASSLFALPQVDSVVAIAAAVMLIFGGWHIGKSAFDALMDRSADQATIDRIAAVAERWPGVVGFHDLKTRMAGTRVFVQIHIELDGDQPLREAHAIGASLRRAILDAVPNADVIVHKDVAR